MLTKPAVGSIITITVSNNARSFWPTPSDIYTGTVVESNKWDNDNTVKLHTGNPKYPNSIIPLGKIIDIIYSDGTMPTYQQANVITTESWTVDGSKPGTKYLVVREGSHFKCDCVAFQFRKKCKHIDQIKEQLTNSIIPV